MSVKWVVLVIVNLTLAGCSPAEISSTSEFKLCNNLSRDQISIDFVAKRGLLFDVEDSIRPCVSGGMDCIDFPFLFSSPSTLPLRPGDTVIWDVGGHRFSMTAENRSPDYQIVARRDDGTVYKYVYGDDGITRLNVGSAKEDGWHRCSGRMTFSSMREMLQSPVGQ
jgi:hypothetical protein